jgi:hypothetical protein
MRDFAGTKQRLTKEITISDLCSVSEISVINYGMLATGLMQMKRVFAASQYVFK